MSYGAHEILLLNPRKKRAKRAGSKKRTTKKRTTKKRTGAKRTGQRKTRRNPAKRTTTRKPAITKGRATTMAKKKTKKRSTRRNPSKRGSRAKRAIRYAGASFAGMNFRSAIKNVPLGLIGMFAAKYAAKRGTPDALESDPSTWNGMTYLKAALGATVAGYVGNMIRRGSGQKILEGGMLLIGYKVAQNHLIPKNSFLTNQLGFGQEQYYTAGDVATNDAGEPFVLGENGNWIPLDSGEDVTAMLGQDDWMEGDVFETPGRLGQATQAAYARSLFES